MRPLLLSIVVLSAACSAQEPPQAPVSGRTVHRPPTYAVSAAVRAGGVTVNLPKEQGAWTRPDAPRHVTAATIFDYMDGGGELYLAYRFEGLDVFEYQPSDTALGTILVELYAMKGPDEAFGLLSSDWSGETIPLGAAGEDGVASVPSSRALFGAGLLRLCAGPLYARILAARDTPETREVVLALGRAVAGSAPRNQPPALVRALPAQPSPGLSLRPDRTVFLRSHLVLNSAYYLASENILELGLDVEALTGEYKPSPPGERPIRVIAVQYPSPARARSALESFARAYLPEASLAPAQATSGVTKVEHGWVGWVRLERSLALAFDAVSAAQARAVAGETAKRMR